MKRKFFLLILFSCCIAYAQVNKKGDFQVWDYTFLEFDINDKFSTNLVTEFRWGDDASKLYFKYGQALFVYKPFYWLHVAPGYRQLFARTPRGGQKWTTVYSPLLDVTFILPRFDWTFATRNRLQYLIIDGFKNRIQYRNRFMVFPAYKALFLDIMPFAFDEVFFQETRGFFENRLAAGITANFSKGAGGRFFYILRHLKRPQLGWSYQNILALKLYLSF